MMLPSLIALVCAGALLRGGSLRNLANLHLRGVPLVVGGFALQLLIFTPLRKTPLLVVAIPQLYILSMALLMFWVALNRHIPGVALMAAGLLMNTIAIAANSGHMPVAPEMVRYAGTTARYSAAPLPVANNSIATDAGVRLWLLTDILAAPGWAPFANVFSIGDVLLTIGTGRLCYLTIRPTARPTRVSDWALWRWSGCASRVSPGMPELVQRLKCQLIAMQRLIEQDDRAVADLTLRAARLRRRIADQAQDEQARCTQAHSR